MRKVLHTHPVLICPWPWRLTAKSTGFILSLLATCAKIEKIYPLKSLSFIMFTRLFPYFPTMTLTFDLQSQSGSSSCHSWQVWRGCILLFWVELNLLVFYVTCNDISVIYVTALMCRRTEEEVLKSVSSLQGQSVKDANTEAMTHQTATV